MAAGAGAVRIVIEQLKTIHARVRSFSQVPKSWMSALPRQSRNYRRLATARVTTTRSIAVPDLSPLMRWIPILAVFLAATGCTQTFLTSNTLRTARSVADLQTQQVLDNLALIACQPEASPSQLNITSGLVQVTDQANGTLLANLLPYSLASNNALSPSLSAQRGLVVQWSVNPVTDGPQLETLRLAYRKALDPANPDIDDKILDQIVSLCVRFTLLPQDTTIQRILATDDAKKKAYELVQSLNGERNELKKRISHLEDYRNRALKENHTDTANQLERELGELNAQKVLKERQRRLLRELTSQSNESEDAKEPGALPVLGASIVGLPASPPGQGSFLAAFALIPGRAEPGRSFRAKGSRSPLVPSDASDTTLVILTVLAAKAPPAYLPRHELLWETTRNPALVDQAEDQIAALEDLLKMKTPWICCGCRSDVPRSACYTGYYEACQEKCAVWVMPAEVPSLHKVTRTILTLAAPTVMQETPARSPAFSPSLR
jgi:hypothetical protein